MTNARGRWTLVPMFGFAALAVGCGGSSNTDGADSTSTGAGSGGSTSSDSGATSDSGTTGTTVFPRGAASFTVTTCQQYTGGISKNGNVPTNDFPGDRLEDGEDGTSVSCRITGGSPYEISGVIQGANSHPSATFSGETIEIRIENGMIEETGLGTAEISLTTGQIYRSQTANPCTLSLDAGTGQEVAVGRVFASFNCSGNLDVVGSPITDCSAIGVIVFERCEE